MTQDHVINVQPWQSRRPALAAHFDWTCSCGRKASNPCVDRRAAEADALRHTPVENTVSAYSH
ncbi:hypothetical protein ACFYW9_41095 [Streptomyces sp. NPDC002698]|uniref:hypothetical protein n=1 Tax=Streptomyces sp. NPDC002698 TaxID=3364660 RepID=UPI0036A12438